MPRPEVLRNRKPGREWSGVRENIGEDEGKEAGRNYVRKDLVNFILSVIGSKWGAEE